MGNGQVWANVAGQAATTTLGTAMGLIWAKKNDKRQLEQQKKLSQQQIEFDKQMLDYQKLKEMEMWKATSYPGQMAMMKEAGINPGLMYGMGGGGGQTTGGSSAHVGAPGAPSGGGELPAAMSMGMQLQLMKAQKENIEADTENKKGNTIKTGEEAIKLQLENVINDLVANMDEDGKPVNEGEDHKRLGFKEKVQEVKKSEAETTFRIDENKRQEIMNNERIKEIAAEIDLMSKRGATEVEMRNNLEKEGKIKDLEIEWQNMGLQKDSITRFLSILIQRAVGGK